MSDEQELQVSISGKAVYKAVKNLLQNDSEFKRQVSEQMAKQMHDVDVIKVLVQENVSRLLEDPKIKRDIDLVVKESIEKALPLFFKDKVDNIMKNALMDTYKKLIEKGKPR